MKNIILRLCSLFFLSHSALAGTGAVLFTGKLVKHEAGYAELKNGRVGEFTQKQQHHLVELELKGAGDLAGFPSKKEVVESKDVAGVDFKGRSEGRLIKDAAGKLFWKTEFEVEDKDGNLTKDERELEVEFTKGDFVDFEKGDAVEFRYTKEAREKFVDEHQKSFIAIAEAIHDQSVKQFPKAKIEPVKVLKNESAGHGTFKGDAKAINFTAPTVLVECSVDVAF